MFTPSSIVTSVGNGGGLAVVVGQVVEVAGQEAVVVIVLGSHIAP